MELGEKITIDQLAGMMKTSFDDLSAKMNEGFKEVKDDIIEIKNDVREVKTDIVEMNHRLGIIEGKLINNHENRISKTEDDVRLIKTKLQIS